MQRTIHSNLPSKKGLDSVAKSLYLGPDKRAKIAHGGLTMHNSAYLLIPLRSAVSSEAARRYAKTYLEQNNFARPSGRWDQNPIDSYVIGGRWSGLLTQVHLDRVKLKKFWKQFEKKGLGWVSRTVPAKVQRQKAEALFYRYFPDFDTEKIPCPVYRDSYVREGFHDDAMIVDEIIWEKIIEPGLESELLEGGAILHANSDSAYESELVKEEVISKCWCVVIDFHC
ncbi:MAG: hypothetical protein KCHDKBKB_01026 [Elusimicrobia bacterium]|nr:hypothetical protein [Elusimicrobiota bacterium]